MRAIRREASRASRAADDSHITQADLDAAQAQISAEIQKMIDGVNKNSTSIATLDAILSDHPIMEIPNG